MRGLAAASVAMYHMCWALDPTLFRPQDDGNSPPRFWQLPIIRVIISGRTAVPVFFILTGFTSAARSIKLSHIGDTDSAYRGLGRSAAKRVFQLVLPTATGTVLNWLLCELGIFNMAHKTDSIWIREMTPKPSKTLLSAVIHLLTAIKGTWTRESNPYSTEQWCMMDLLVASMSAYTIMLATVRCRPAARITLIVGIIVYGILTKDGELFFYFLRFRCSLT